MGLFSTKEVYNNTIFQVLSSVSQLDEILKSSHENFALIFKHSTRCSISAMALKNFQNQWIETSENCQLYYLDLLQHRNISNLIEQKLNVIHQSPQVILIKNEEVIHHSSHQSIDANQLKKLIR
jgi:bacillithiol system protein YtxJ